MKTILFISGGAEAIPGILRAKEMGIRTVVSDGNPQAPGFEVADYSILSSTYDVEGTVRKAVDFNHHIKELNGVICVASDVPHTVAAVAATLKLPGISIWSANLAIDKLAMKDNFLKNRITIPRYSAINSYHELERIIDEWGYPLIIKPVDSRGARGVLRLTENIDTLWAWKHSRENSPTRRVMIEEYLDGPQVSTESLMIEGNCYTPGFSDRNYEFLDKYAPHIIENGGDLPSHLPNSVQDNVKALVERAALSMGIRDGVVKGDIVVHKEKPYVIELAARLSGGFFCTHEVPLNTGVDLVGIAIRHALGENIHPNELKPKMNQFICQRYLFPRPGKVLKINGREELANLEKVMYLHSDLKIGDIIESPKAHPARPGMVITRGTSRFDAQESANKALSMFEIDYEE